jgi:hypothetical protein
MIGIVNGSLLDLVTCVRENIHVFGHEDSVARGSIDVREEGGRTLEAVHIVVVLLLIGNSVLAEGPLVSATEQGPQNSDETQEEDNASSESDRDENDNTTSEII